MRLKHQQEHFFANRLLVASGYYAKPRIPAFAGKLDMKIKQLHSSEYTNPHELPNGEVLVVGAGASGVQIAIDVARYRPTIIAGNSLQKFLMSFLNISVVFIGGSSAMCLPLIQNLVAKQKRV